VTNVIGDGIVELVKYILLDINGTTLTTDNVSFKSLGRTLISFIIDDEDDYVSYKFFSM
jgi:hypothetical protein